MGTNITSNVVCETLLRFRILPFQSHTIQVYIKREHTIYDIFKGNENSDSPRLLTQH